MIDDRFEELLGGLMDGELSPDELSELVRLARDEPSRRDEILRQLESAEMIALAEDELRDASLFVSAIRDRLGEDAFVSRVQSAVRGGRRHEARRSILPWAIAAAALLVLALSVLSQLELGPGTAGDTSAQVPAPIARITELEGSVTWIGDGGQMNENPEAGDALAGGTLEAHSLNSLAEIVFTDGSSVWVSGPAVLTLSNGEAGKLIRLREGDLSLNVSPQPADRPLRLVTPSAEAVVLGTQFNVAADSSSTRLTVNEGLVRVKRIADGSVEEVGADQRVVVELEQETKFKALPRGEHVRTWKSEFPRDVRLGEWEPGAGDGPGFLRAEAHLFRGDHGERINPILLHSAVVGPANGLNRPVLLTEGARFRIQGRLGRSFRVNIGFGTHAARGGFSGKYTTNREINVSPEGGRFELELALDEFPRVRSLFPESPAGHELVWFWIQTVKEDAGLEVFSVELLASEPDPAR